MSTSLFPSARGLSSSRKVFAHSLKIGRSSFNELTKKEDQTPHMYNKQIKIKYNISCSHVCYNTCTCTCMIPHHSANTLHVVPQSICTYSNVGLEEVLLKTKTDPQHFLEVLNLHLFKFIKLKVQHS